MVPSISPEPAGLYLDPQYPHVEFLSARIEEDHRQIAETYAAQRKRSTISKPSGGRSFYSDANMC